jgi:hypothetical protein
MVSNRMGTSGKWVIIGVIGVGAALGLFDSGVTAFSSFSPPISGATVIVSGLNFPSGVIHDGAHLFVTTFDNHFYRFPATGGSPDIVVSNRLNVRLLQAHGHYYGLADANSMGGNHGVYSFDPNTLALGPKIAATPGLERGLAGDPLSTDLYVADNLGNLLRIENPDSASPTVTPFFHSSSDFDQIYFKHDGSILFGASNGSDHVIGIDRTGAAVVDVVLAGRHPDGIAVAQPNTIVQTPGGPVDVSNNVFVNSNDGTVERIDVNNGNALSVVMSGGSRGDLATVGPDRCLYITQSHSIERIEPCFFQTTLNHAPVTQDGALFTDEDVAQALTLQAADSDGDALTYSVVAGPTHGVLSGTPPDLTYTPASNYYGPDSLTFEVDDGHLQSSSAVVSITVNPVNDSPVAGDDSVSTNANTPLLLSTSTLLSNDSDADGDSLTITSVQQTASTHGSAALAGGDVQYVPTSGFVGTASFGYTISDGHGGTGNATVTIAVLPSSVQPDCTNVRPSSTTLWPPNHAFTLLTVTGARDGLGHPIAGVVETVTQDEPVKGLGDGDTSPDAKLVHGRPDQVFVRAERAGPGDGRVYRICVPRDRRQRQRVHGDGAGLGTARPPRHRDRLASDRQFIRPLSCHRDGAHATVPPRRIPADGF